MHFTCQLEESRTICFRLVDAALRCLWKISDRFLHIAAGIRDFKIWRGEAVVRRQMVKITSVDVMTRVPLRLSRRSLAFYYGKVSGFTYSSLREYKPVVYFSF